MRPDRSADQYWGGASNSFFDFIIIAGALFFFVFVIYWGWSGLNFTRGRRRLDRCVDYKNIIQRNGFQIDSAQSFGGNDISVRIRSMHSLECFDYVVPYPESGEFAEEFDENLRNLNERIRNRYLD